MLRRVGTGAGLGSIAGPDMVRWNGYRAGLVIVTIHRPIELGGSNQLRTTVYGCGNCLWPFIHHSSTTIHAYHFPNDLRCTLLLCDIR